MFYVYILKSTTSGLYYIGFTSDLKKRLNYHNRGASRFTRKRGPWQLIYSEEYADKKSAWLREKQIKSYKGGEAFKKLVI